MEHHPTAVASLQEFFSSAGMMPHGHCYLWRPGLVYLHVVSDLLIGTAYVWIALALYFLVKRIRLPFSGMFMAFGLFIGACGLTHFMAVWTLWNPDYWVSGFVKAITAFASVATGVLLIPLVPRVVEVARLARLSEDRRVRLESAHAELQGLYQRVKELDEAKTRFFENVSHELRTPLTLILGPIESLLRRPDLNESSRQDLETALSNAKLLRKQVDDLLDVSRVEAGEMKLEPAEFDLAELVRITSGYFQEMASRRQVELTIDTPKAVPVRMDRQKIERVLINLLSNAFKFVPDRGVVRVALARENSQAVISIADSGPGIPPERRKEVFERFRQVDLSSGPRAAGSGLGLAIVRDFVELHHGSVEVDAAPEGGALFIVRLPAPADVELPEVFHGAGADQTDSEAIRRGAVAEVEQQRAVVVRAARVVTDAPKVLVVEDSAALNRFVSETLHQDLSVSVLSAADGQEGFEVAVRTRPDVIVSDVMMPRLSGEQMLDRIRSEKSLEHVPVLFLTAKADEVSRVRLLRKGANDYLQKPFARDELTVRVRNLLTMKLARDTLAKDLAVVSNDLEVLAREAVSRKRELQVALEAARIARDQAEQASMAKANFLSLASHELRTPLTSLGMNLELLRRRTEPGETGEMSEPFAKRMRVVEASFGRVSELVESIIAYAAIETGGIQLELVSADFGMLVRDGADAFRQVAADKGLEITVLESTGLGRFPTHPDFVRTIIRNLVSNAVRFTAEGRITVSLEGDAAQRVISVSDTGPGIAESDIDRIFEPFEQLEPIRHKSVPGVGLGLAVVRRAAESLSGRVEVESQVGKGTTFRVILPLVQ